MKPKTCGECHYIRRTSPEQVLLRCDFWCATEYPVKGAADYVGRDFVLAHCHVGEGEPACLFAMPKEVANDTASVGVGFAHANALLPAT